MCVCVCVCLRVCARASLCVQVQLCVCLCLCLSVYAAYGVYYFRRGIFSFAPNHSELQPHMHIDTQIIFLDNSPSLAREGEGRKRRIFFSQARSTLLLLAPKELILWCFFFPVFFSFVFQKNPSLYPSGTRLAFLLENIIELRKNKCFSFFLAFFRAHHSTTKE